MEKIGKLVLQNGRYLAYRKYMPKNPTSSCGVVFFHGFQSKMTGTKCTFLYDYCQKRNVPFLRFDHEGQGESSGNIKDVRLSRWKENALKVLRELTEGPQILIGYSGGVWVMVLAALEMPDRVKAMVGLASAPDTLYRRYLELSPQEQTKVQRQGYMMTMSGKAGKFIPMPFEILEDAKQYMVMLNEIRLDCPVRLIHGMNDVVVPYETSIRFADRLRSRDVQTLLVKDGEHGLSTGRDLKLLEKSLDDLYRLIDL